MASASTLAAAVIKITAPTGEFKKGLEDVYAQLNGFVGVAQMMGGRIGGALMGAIGQHLIGQAAEKALGPTEAGLEAAEKRVSRHKKEMDKARAEVMDVGATMARLKASGIEGDPAAFLQAKADFKTAQAAFAASKLILGNAQAAASAAKTAFTGAAGGLTAIATGATVAITGLVLLIPVLIAVTNAAANLDDAVHNMNQTFGTAGKAIGDAADVAATKFGTNRAEFIAYANDVGRSLTNLGMDAKLAAEQAAVMGTAVQRLAIARRMSFSEATKQVGTHGALFSEDEILGWAIQNKILTNRNEILDEGNKLIIRNHLAIEKIGRSTEESFGAGFSWTNQLNKLWGQLGETMQQLGRIAGPVLTSILVIVNGVLEVFNSLLKAIGDMIVGIITLGGLLSSTDVEGADAMIAGDTAEARKRRILGEAYGGGGGGGGGFQGGLADFWKKVQESAFSNRQIAKLDKQITVLEKIEQNTRKGATEGQATESAMEDVLGPNWGLTWR